MAKSRVSTVFDVTDDELIQLVNEIGGGDVQGVMGDLVGLRLSDEMWANVGNIAKVVAFKVFDPRKVARAVAAKLARFDDDDHGVAEVSLDGTVCKYTNEPTTMDLSFLITLFLLRGNSVPKIWPQQTRQSRLSYKGSALRLGFLWQRRQPGG